MIKVKKTFDINEIDQIKFLLGDLYTKDCKEHFAFFFDNKLIGAFIVFNTNDNEIAFCINHKNSYQIAKALRDVFNDILPKYKQITSKVNIDNVKSIKCTKQLGARVVYISSNGLVNFIFQKELWRFQKKLPLN